MTYGAADRIARLVPTQPNTTLDSALTGSQELRAAYDSEPETQKLVDQARKLEGVARHAGTHAAAVVIAREPLIENVPLQRPARAEDDDDSAIPMTQWAMNQCAAIGLLKMDFLGLTNLTILEAAVAIVEDETGERPDYVKLPDGDPETFAMLSTGDTFGVFQLESAGMRRYVQDLKPTQLSDLAAMVALYRPGPMDHIPRFIRSKHGDEAISYPHPDLAEILDATYGVIVYQDQVLQIARKFAGYTLGQADIMRKAMGKKDAEIMQAERGRFVQGAERLGYSVAQANTVFDLVEPFAGYAFNKAHAVCYGSIAYQTAYLKAHHPVAYMTAVLRAAGGNSDRVGLAAAECARMGAPLLPPDINRSRATFQTEALAGDRRGVRIGLTNVKNVGRLAMDTLIAERDANGPFASLEDLCRRAGPGRREQALPGESDQGRRLRRPGRGGGPPWPPSTASCAWPSGNANCATAARRRCSTSSGIRWRRRAPCSGWRTSPAPTSRARSNSSGKRNCWACTSPRIPTSGPARPCTHTSRSPPERSAPSTRARTSSWRARSPWCDRSRRARASPSPPSRSRTSRARWNSPSGPISTPPRATSGRTATSSSRTRACVCAATASPSPSSARRSGRTAPTAAGCATTPRTGT